MVQTARLSLILALAGALGACSVAQGEPGLNDPASPSIPSVTADAPAGRDRSTSTLAADDLPHVVAVAITDLAARIGIPEAEVRLVASELVDWPDASLDCPLPGVMYAQVVTPGYRLVLEASTATFEYHTDEAGSIVLCRDGEPILREFPVTPGEIDDGKPWMPVD